ncbi:hypothetical protein C8J56DRAFT_1061264 [Mycena floridula]|nr:hypothetical protein C8J56DRAFT_1061264 [Mycena floridula]
MLATTELLALSPQQILLQNEGVITSEEEARFHSLVFPTGAVAIKEFYFDRITWLKEITNFKYLEPRYDWKVIHNDNMKDLTKVWYRKPITFALIRGPDSRISKQNFTDLMDEFVWEYGGLRVKDESEVSYDEHVEEQGKLAEAQDDAYGYDYERQEWSD